MILNGFQLLSVLWILYMYLACLCECFVLVTRTCHVVGWEPIVRMFTVLCCSGFLEKLVRNVINPNDLACVVLKLLSALGL